MGEKKQRSSGTALDIEKREDRGAVTCLVTEIQMEEPIQLRDLLTICLLDTKELVG
jgi:hypothetical protein